MSCGVLWLSNAYKIGLFGQFFKFDFAIDVLTICFMWRRNELRELTT